MLKFWVWLDFYLNFNESKPNQPSFGYVFTSNQLNRINQIKSWPASSNQQQRNLKIFLILKSWKYLKRNVDNHLEPSRAWSLKHSFIDFSASNCWHNDIIWICVVCIINFNFIENSLHPQYCLLPSSSTSSSSSNERRSKNWKRVARRRKQPKIQNLRDVFFRRNKFPEI